MTREELLATARTVAERAYCPYSHFRVGAALIAGGKLYTGVNIEISSYGLTLCAERAALAAAISAGAAPITHIAVACIDARSEAPVNKPGFYNSRFIAIRIWSIVGGSGEEGGCQRVTLDKSHSLVYAISPRNFVVVGMGRHKACPTMLQGFHP